MPPADEPVAPGAALSVTGTATNTVAGSSPATPATLAITAPAGVTITGVSASSGGTVPSGQTGATRTADFPGGVANGTPATITVAVTVNSPATRTPGPANDLLFNGRFTSPSAAASPVVAAATAMRSPPQCPER